MNYVDDNSVYVILINDDNTAITTQKRRIVQKSKLVDSLWFLVNPNYNGFNMNDFTAVLEYLSPISRKYRTEFLSLSDEMYNGYLKYVLPLDTTLTDEAGDVEMMVSFLKADLDENGRGIQRARKITECTISITPISAWSDIIPDCALTALDQRIIKMDAQIRAINESSVLISDTKADDISFDKESNELQLMSNGKLIGRKVVLSASVDEDGLPVVDFTGTQGTPEVDSDDNDDNSSDIIEF